MTDKTDTDKDTIHVSPVGKLVILASGFVPSFANAGLMPVLPAIAAYFAQTPNAEMLVRLLVSIVGVTVAISAPITGALADRYGQRRVLLIAMVAFGIFGSVGFFLDDLYQILASRMVMGVATAAIGATMLTIIATRSAGNARNRWLGYLQVVSAASTLAFMPLAGYLGEFGWRYPFLIHLVTLIFAAMVIVGFERDAPRGTAAATQKSTGHPLADIPWKFILFALASGIVLITHVLFVPFHLRDIGVTDPKLLAMAMIPSSIVSAIAAFLYGNIRKSLSMSVTFAVFFGLSAIGHVIMGLGQVYWVVVFGQAIAGACTGVIATNAYALAAITGSDANRARTMGCAKACLFIGPMVGQFMLEPIVKVTSAGMGLLVLAAYTATLTAGTVVYVLGTRKVAVSPT